MPTVHTVPTDFADLATALAHADVSDTDTIQLHYTHVENGGSAITVSKEVTIKTLGSAGQATISEQLIIDASNVTLTNLKLNHDGADGSMIKPSANTHENLTINYCTIDCKSSSGHSATNTTDKIIVVKDSTISGVFTFDNNTVLQSRCGAALEVGTGAGGIVTEAYIRDNKFIDHRGAIVVRGGDYTAGNSTYLDTNDGNKEKYSKAKTGVQINKVVISGNQVNVDGLPGTASAATAAKNAGGSSDGTAYALVQTYGNEPWGVFEVNQCKDVEMTGNTIKNYITAYLSAASLQTWNVSGEWKLNVKNNIFQDLSGCGGIKVYLRYSGFGIRHNGDSLAYMPTGSIEKNDFINCDLFALASNYTAHFGDADADGTVAYNAATNAYVGAEGATFDSFIVDGSYNNVFTELDMSGGPVYPSNSDSIAMNPSTIWGSKQKWMNYDSEKNGYQHGGQYNAQNNYFYPTTGQIGTDVSGQVVGVSDNRPPRNFNRLLNIAEGDVNHDGYLTVGVQTSSSAPSYRSSLPNTGVELYHKSWVIAEGNKSSIMNAETYPVDDPRHANGGLQGTFDTFPYSLVRHNQYLDYQTYSLYSADPSQNISIQIPVLFDVSGSALLYGEEYEDDMIDAHLNFTLDMRTDSTNPFKVDDLTGCFRVGDQDISGHNLFYVNNHTDTSGNQVDLFCEKLSKSILEGNLKHVVNDGDHSTGGIPIGGQALVTSDGSANALATYTKKYLTSIAPSAGAGENVGTCMARLAAVHLVGHPLSQAIFTNEKMLQTDVARVTAIKKGDATNVFANTLASQLSKALGGSYTNKHDGVGGDASGNKVLLPGLAAANDNTSGVKCNNGTVNPVLQSIFEQLVANGGRATEINTATDLSLNDSDVTKTTTAAFPFHANDELVVYIRPKLHLTFDTAVQTGVAILDSDGTAMDISGLVHRDALASNMAQSFPGCSAGQKGGQAYKYSWMGSPDNIRNSGNGRDLDQETTDETDPSVLDAHVWKITIKL